MKLVRDPLLLFLLAGAALFALERGRGDRDAVVHVAAADAARLAAQWQAQAGRAPTPAELDALIEDFVREEIMVREATALGLDRDDVVIRRRLAQKLAFVSEDLAVLEPPTAAALRGYLAENAARYRTPARLDFSHVFFSADERADPGADARAALATIGEDDWRGFGDPTILRRTYRGATEAEISSEFGYRFFARLDAVTEPGWTGPIDSAFGSHLVRVEARSPARAPDFETIVDRLARDYDAERRRRANAAYYAGLRARYRVEIER